MRKLITAIRTHNMKVFKEEIRYVDVDAYAFDHYTPLFAVINNEPWPGQLQMIKILLERGADVNKGTGMEYTPLHLAAAWGNIEVVKALLAVRRVDPNIKRLDGDGNFALWSASNAGHVDVVKALLAAGAKVNLANNKQVTSLAAAAAARHTEVVKALLEAGADVLDEYDEESILTGAEKGKFGPEIAKVFADFIAARAFDTRKHAVAHWHGVRKEDAREFERARAARAAAAGAGAGVESGGGSAGAGGPVSGGRRKRRVTRRRKARKGTRRSHR